MTLRISEDLEPQARAEVDLERLRRRMATTIERAAAEDPAQLRRRVQELETKLRAARAAKPAPERVECRSSRRSSGPTSRRR